MISASCFGTNDLARAGEFYDKVLATLGARRLDANDNEIGYGIEGSEPVFWVLLPFNREPATYGNGSQIIFTAPDAPTVDLFYKTAIDNGGSDEGVPGVRGYATGYYGAYCRDPDGNKLHVYTMTS